MSGWWGLGRFCPLFSSQQPNWLDFASQSHSGGQPPSLPPTLTACATRGYWSRGRRKGLGHTDLTCILSWQVSSGSRYFTFTHSKNLMELMAWVLQAQTLEPSCLTWLPGSVSPTMQVIKPLSASVSSPFGCHEGSNMLYL